MLTEIMVAGKSMLQDAEARVCNIVSVRMWPIQTRVPLSTAGLIDVIKMVRSWRRRAPDRPETKPSIVISQYVQCRIMPITIYMCERFTFQ